MHLLKNLMLSLKALLHAPINLTRLQKKFPTCRFHLGATIDKESILGNYNVIFNDVSVINSILGDHTFIQKNSIVSNSKIGKFCSIAMNVNIGLAQHAMDKISSHPAFYLQNTPLIKTFSNNDAFMTMRSVIIGHDVWIGQNVLIMGGITIGTGAVVGAGAVVTKDVPEYAIVVGVPAKIVGYRFRSDIIADVIKSKWWNKPNQWLKENHLLFSNPSRFLEYVRKDRQD